MTACRQVLAGVILASLCLLAAAQDAATRSAGYVADIELQTVEEFRQLLLRVEEMVAAGSISAGEPAPVAFVLHGPVVRNLLRENYVDNKPTVDLAARLSALGMVDVKACRTWMASHEVEAAGLQPFVTTVRLGSGEVERLVRESNYVYF